MAGDAEGLYDLREIFSLRDCFAGLDPAGASRAAVVEPAPAARSIGILSGSFDPLTNAHAALAQAALAGGGVEAVYFALSRHTVDKETRQRPTDVDRALAVRLWLRDCARHGLILFNRGLYADQALAARAAFPGAAIRFVVGHDKAAQIFDSRYYTDRDATLRILFGAAELLVAPRAADDEHALAALLDQPQNRPFRPYASSLPFDPSYAADSSTAVRAAYRAGHAVAHLVPPEAAAFMRELAPYVPINDDPAAPDRYSLRESLIAALAADRAWAEQHADLRAMLDQATAPTASGRRLRRWLAADPATRVSLANQWHVGAG